MATGMLTSCAPARPKLVGEELGQSFVAGLMQEWSELSTHFTSVKGLAKVKVSTPEKSLNGTQVLLAERPDRLRAETLSPFGSPLLLLATDGEQLGVFLPSRSLFYAGAATPENLSRFVRIPLQLNDLVSVLLYQPPLIDAWNEVGFELEGSGWLVVRSGLSSRQELSFNHNRQLVEMSYYNHDTLLLKINYGNFSDAGARFPRSFAIELPEQKTHASLEFSEPEINAEMKFGIFQLTPPEGATIVSLDDE